MGLRRSRYRGSHRYPFSHSAFSTDSSCVGGRGSHDADALVAFNADQVVPTFVIHYERMPVTVLESLWVRYCREGLGVVVQFITAADYV